MHFIIQSFKELQAYLPSPQEAILDPSLGWTISSIMSRFYFRQKVRDEKERILHVHGREAIQIRSYI